MKKSITCLLFIVAFIFSSGLLIAQNPTTIVCQGTLTNISGAFIAGEECIVTFLIANSDEAQLFKYESSVTTTETGEFTVSAENLPEVFTDKGVEELLSIELIIKPSEGSSWLEEDSFNVKYYLEKNETDEFTLTRYKGQILNLSVQDFVWAFSDIYPFAYLSSRFLISFSEDLTDPNTIIFIGKNMNRGMEMEESVPPPSKRGIKGSYAVGGYKK